MNINALKKGFRDMHQYCSSAESKIIVVSSVFDDDTINFP